MPLRPSSLIVAAVIALSAAAATTQVFAVAEEAVAPVCAFGGVWASPASDAAATAATPAGERLALVDKRR